MTPRWNAWTHLQSVQFDYEKMPRIRQVRLCGPSPMPGELACIAVSGVEVEVVIVSVVPGLLAVKDLHPLWRSAAGDLGTAIAEAGLPAGSHH